MLRKPYLQPITVSKVLCLIGKLYLRIIVMEFLGK